MFDDTFEGATSFCEACEIEVRDIKKRIIPVEFHTCGKYDLAE